MFLLFGILWYYLDNKHYHTMEKNQKTTQDLARHWEYGILEILALSERVVEEIL